MSENKDYDHTKRSRQQRRREEIKKMAKDLGVNNPSESSLLTLLLNVYRDHPSEWQVIKDTIASIIE